MASVGTNFLILFGLTSLLAFFFPLWKDGVVKQLSIKTLASSLLPSLAVLLPFSALFGLAGMLNIPIAQTLPAFLGAAILQLVLSRIGLPATMRGVLLLVAAYLFTAFVKPETGINFILSAAMLGLIVGKLSDHLLLGSDRTLDDIFPPLIWLTTVAWAQSLDNKAIATQREAIVLSIMSIAQFLRIMQRPFTKDDRVFIKRVVLATSGGLGVLLVLTKFVMNDAMQPLALLCGAGMFATYMFQNIDKEGQDKINGTTAVNLLIVVGVLTMVATRFFGTFGLLALAPCAMVSPWFSITQFAGLFFCVRTLLQLFINTYNSNVTGINIEHAYVGAAQYAGFISIACMMMLLREIKDRRVLTALFLGGGVLMPMAANYYLHAEPTASMLVASTVAGVVLAVLGPALMRSEEAIGYENLLLLPAMMVTVGVTFGGLIDAGNEANNQLRAQILAYALGALVLVALISWFLNKVISNKKTASAGAE